MISADVRDRLPAKTGTLAAALETLNPFRYRSYVRGEKMGVQTLRSRGCKVNEINRAPAYNTARKQAPS